MENNRQDLLDRWDYEKNECTPSEMPYRTRRKAYFKCPKCIHESEAKRMIDVTDKPDHEVQCKGCGDGKNQRQDLTGNVYGDLTVLYFDEEKSENKSNKYWMCECSCGRTVSVIAASLTGGKKTKCGGKKHLPSLSEEIKYYDPESASEIKRLRRSGLYVQYREAVKKKDGCRCIVCGST